ncbi:MAG: hypothetical protein RBR35_12450 [Salinivirgaceae bacterium]|nr:hypothetical protein [Salinivirgaceae bacterium]
MSSLIFLTDQDNILVATDTLGTSSKDNSSSIYTTKAFIVPHLKMIICGTGVDLAAHWFIQVNNGSVVRGIDHLNCHTPDALKKIWLDADLINDLNGVMKTSTIYHFGLSENSGCIRSYAYRSTNQFKSETLEYGLGVKPPVSVQKDIVFPEGIVELMNRQREIESTKPIMEQVRIGGEIVLTSLTQKGFTVSTIGRFADFAEDQQIMFNNFKTNNR